MKLRPARASDAPAARRVIVAAYAPWRAKLDDLPDVTEGLADDLAREGSVVAEENGMLRGVLITDVAKDALQVQNIAVAPEAAGQGVGRALMARAEEMAADAGLPTLRLATHRDMGPTRAFYDRLGWEVVGEEGNKVMMVRRLPSPGERQ